MVEEFALSPSTRWYDFKKGGAGLKYEVALSIHTNEIIWIRGPLSASVHDISMFRGCTTEQKKQKKIDKWAAFLPSEFSRQKSAHGQVHVIEIIIIVF